MSEPTHPHYDRDAHTHRFRHALSQKPHIEYWTHNPWQRNDIADAEITRIADRYLERFTDSMMDLGYMPFTGVEVNALTHGVQAKEIVSKLHALLPDYYDAYVHRHPHLQEAVHALINSPVATEIEEAGPARPYHVLRTFSDLGEHYNKHGFIARPQERSRHYESHEATMKATITNIHSAFAKLEKQGWLSQEHIYYLGREIDYLCNIPTPRHQVDPELKSLFDNYVSVFSEKRANAYDPAIGLGHNHDERGNSELNGRIYQDFGPAEELEIATRAASPAETVHSVNVIKQMLYESSYRYEDLYAASSGLPESEHERLRDEAPRGELASYLRNTIPAAYNITYGISHDNCGEHISVSLQRRTQPNQTYDNARTLDSDQQHSEALVGFGKNNLMASDMWRNLMQTAYMNFLSHDTLLGAGNDRIFEKVRLAQKRGGNPHHITRENGSDRSYLSRVEVRSFHDASSNISVSMLAVMAVTYAVIREIERDPDLRNIFYDNQTSLTQYDVDTVLERLHSRYGAYSALPDSIQMATERFHHLSPTLAMMREWVQENATGDQDKAELMQEVDAFEHLAVERVHQNRLPVTVTRSNYQALIEAERQQSTSQRGYTGYR